MRAKRMVYKDVLLPDTIHGCRDLLKRLIDKLEVRQDQANLPDLSRATLTVEPFLRVPNVE